MSVQPVLKYPGGKRGLSVHIGGIIREHLTTAPKTARLHVPFAGGMAVALSVAPLQATVTDLQENLMSFYQLVASDHSRVEAVYSALASEFNSDVERRNEIYYGSRDWFNGRSPEMSDVPAFMGDSVPRTGQRWQLAASIRIARAGAYLFMNRSGFNGLQRYNLSGGFNVPLGSYGQIPGAIDLAPISNVIRSWTMMAVDFNIMNQATAGDIVYCDPPYCGTHVAYTARPFTKDDHKRLATNMYRLGKRGVRVITSNSASELTRKLYDYHGFVFEPVTATRSLNRDGKGRGRTVEYLIENVVRK